MDEFLVAEDRVKGVEVVVGEPAAVDEDHPTALELFNRFSEGRGVKPVMEISVTQTLFSIELLL